MLGTNAMHLGLEFINQMEGVYISKVEAKAVQIVELVIVTTPDIVDGKMVEGTPDITPVG